MSRSPPPVCLGGGGAYHVQQAAEKPINGLLVLAGEPFRPTHDMDDLVARLVPVYPQFARQAEAVPPCQSGDSPTAIRVWKTHPNRCPIPLSWNE